MSAARYLFTLDAKWVDDNTVDACSNPKCKMKFGIMPGKHKHHCRWCGKIFCEKCSPIVRVHNSPFKKLSEARQCRPCRVPLILRAYVESPTGPLQANPMNTIMSYLDNRSITKLLQSCATLMHQFHALDIMYRRSLQERFPTLFDGAQVGKGACGTVYKVEDRQEGCRRVAVKVVAKSSVLSYAMWRKLHLEMDIMKGNRHPNIAQLWEVFQTPTCLVMVMQAGEGGNLKHAWDVAKKKRWPLELFAAHVVAQVSSGLQYLFYERRVVHRDIKHDNIVLSKDFSTVLLIDFGLAEYALSDEQRYVPCGTMGYASPENIRAVVERQPTFVASGLTMHLADMFSLGVVVFMLLSGGQKPMKGTKFSELHAEVQRGIRCTGPKWTTVSDEAKQLVEHLLQTPTDRRATPQDVIGHSITRQASLKMADLVAERRKDLEQADQMEEEEFIFVLDDIDPTQFEEDFWSAKRAKGRGSVALNLSTPRVT